jgi:hypothetical protein
LIILIDKGGTRMNAKPIAAARAGRNVARFPTRFALLAAVAALLLAPVALNAADPEGSKPAAKSSAVTLEAIAGSAVKRVVLSEKAAERLGIETGKVGEAPVIRKQMVSGLITAAVDKLPEKKPSGGTFGRISQAGVAPVQTAAESAAAAKPGVGSANFGKVVAIAPATAIGFQKLGGVGSLGKAIAAPALLPAATLAGDSPDGAATAAAAPIPQSNAPIVGDAWVQVALSPGEWERLTKDKPAHLLALSTRNKLGNELLAQPSGMEPVEDAKRSMLMVYYVVPGKDHGLSMNSRVRVELPLAGNEEKQKVVPYSAVYYDGKGGAWVYVNTNPLTFERQRIAVERVAGDVAVLSDGPPVGTPIVTVGASLLYGAEIFGK